MKKQWVLALLALSAGASQAQDVGRVISSTPVVQQVAVPRQVCSTSQVAVQQPNSGAGAVMGAIAGGAVGNALGAGAGKAAATAIGVMGGAIVGDRIEGAGPAQLQNVQNCSVQTTYENRAVAYNVVYEFGGKQYTVQMPQDPGPTIALQVAPLGAVTPGAVPSAQAQPVYVQPAPVVVTAPAYPVYYPPPVQLDLGIGYWGGYRGGWGRWR